MPPLPRNDLRQYDELADQWHDPGGVFAMLHWLADARAALVPPAPRPGALLVDVACGGGLFGPHAQRLGYRHVGLDLNRSGLLIARGHGVLPVQGDAARLPFRSAGADVVVAGEVFEHVPNLPAVVAEVCRVLRPGGTVVLDTIAATAFGRFSSVTVAERIPGGPPPGIHDPALFVDRRQLRTEFSRHGVELTLRGLRLPVGAYLRWAWARHRIRRRARGSGGRSEAPAAALPTVALRHTRTTAGLFQGSGVRSRPTSESPGSSSSTEQEGST